MLIYIYHFVNTEFGGDVVSVGYFTQYITIQHYIDTGESSGDRQRSWQDIRSCWAHVKMLFNNEYLISERVIDGIISTKNYYVFTTRFLKNMQQVTRILWNDKKLRVIRQYEPETRARVIKIMAVEEFEEDASFN